MQIKIEITVLALVISIWIFNHGIKRINIANKSVSRHNLVRLLHELLHEHVHCGYVCMKLNDSGLVLDQCYWNVKSNNFNSK